MRVALPAGPRVNLGCGPVQPAGWIHVDGSHRARLAAHCSWLDRGLTRLGLLAATEFGPHVQTFDLRRPFPFATGSVAALYAGEVWEHFEYPDAQRLTAECLRVLAPGGVLRVCVPDGVTFWRQYLTLYDAQMARPRADRWPQALRDHVGLYFRDLCTRRPGLGSMGHRHKWQFDEIQLVDLFESTGFVAVERMPFHRSRIPGIEAVERSDFLIVEGVKPQGGGGSPLAPQHQAGTA